jgi:anti-sigma B factor antagonist
MDIKKVTNDNTVTVALTGRLDTVTSVQLSNELNPILETGSANLIFDFKELEYISSAGLRVILMAQKKINAQSMDMEIIGANEMVKEVFDMTGFSEILNISC